MGGSLASINIKFQVGLKELSTQLQSAARIAQQAASQFNAAGRTLTFGLTAGIIAFGAASVKTYGDLEGLKKGLISVTGSSAVAAAEFENLKEVAKLPGLGLEEAVRGSVNLQAAGFSALEAKTSLEAFGNALATVGKGKRELDLVTLALTQLNNKSKGFGQDLRQLTEQLPQLRGALTAAFGTSDSEEIAKTGVTGKQVVQLLTKEFAKLPKVTGGINNALENLSDNAKISLAGIGESLNKAFNLEGVIDSIGDSIRGLTESFTALSPNVQKNILVLAGLAASIGPVLLGIGGLLKVVPLVSAGVKALAVVVSFSATQIGTAIVFLGDALLVLQTHAIAITVVLAAVYLIYKSLQEQTTALTGAQRDQAAQQKLLAGVTDEATRSIVSQKARLQQLVYTAKNNKIELKDRKKAIEDINKISPEYLGNITLETINTIKATEAINKYNVALLKGALARAAQSKLDELAKKQVEREFELIKGKEKESELNKNLAKSTEGIASLDAVRLRQQEARAKLSEILAKSQGIKDQKEVDFLTKIINDNKEYLKLLEQVGEAQAVNDAGLKPGTIAYFKDQIKGLQELQEEFETTPEGVAILQGRIDDLQKKIDKLSNVRVKVTSVFEGVDLSDNLNESQGTTSAYDRRIDGLRKLQNEVATTSGFFLALEEQIAQLEVDKAVKFDIEVDSTGLDSAEGKVGVFGQSIKDKFSQTAADLKLISASVVDAFSSISNGMVDSLGLAEHGLQGFIKVLLQGVIKIIAAQLAASMATAIEAGTVAGASTGPAAPGAIPSFIAQLLAVVIGAFAAIPKFETGGIMGGNSYSGDKLFARINSGEMILNQKQQGNLWDMINPAVTAADVAVQIVGDFRLRGSDIELALERNTKNNNRKK